MHQNRFGILRFSALVAMLLIFTIACHGPEWEGVEHKDYDIQFESKSTWDIGLYDDGGWRGRDDTRVVVFQKNSLFDFTSKIDTFTILVETRSLDTPSMEEAIAWSMESIDENLDEEGLQEKPGYEELIFQEETIDGFLAIRRRYTHFYIGDVLAEEIYIVRDDDLVRIELRISKDGFGTYYSEFQHMLDTLNLSGDN